MFVPAATSTKLAVQRQQTSAYPCTSSRCQLSAVAEGRGRFPLAYRWGAAVRKGTLVQYRDNNAPDAMVDALREHLIEAEVPLEAPLKVIGLGNRGVSAVQRLIGCTQLEDAEFWAIDSDKRVLSQCSEAANTIEVVAGEECHLTPKELQAIAGETANSAESAADGSAGVVFVLGAAFGSPGGAPLMLQLVRHLRRQGFFVATALTRPFDFEGPRKLEQADALISLMEEVAHLAVVIEQGKLVKASQELTITGASAIADNTLEYTVRSTLWALRAPEVLKVTGSTFLWHGRDLRLIKRPLFPPMMSLLTCPGHATLGRGQAAIPAAALQAAGLASALSTLAEDAVKAATESPFLDGKMESATGVLAILRLAPSALDTADGAIAADSAKEHALRSAVQVAAMTVHELVGTHCHDIVVCPQLCEDMEVGPAGAGEEAPGLRLEVSLLVIEANAEAAVPASVAVGGDAGSDAPGNAGGGGGANAPGGGSAAAVVQRIQSNASLSPQQQQQAELPAGVAAKDRAASMLGKGGSGAGRGPMTAGAVAAAAAAQQQGRRPGVVGAGAGGVGAGVGAAAAPMQQPAAGPSPAASPAAAGPVASPGAAPAAASAAAASAAAPVSDAQSKKMSRLAAMSALAGGSAASVGGGAAAPSRPPAPPPAPVPSPLGLAISPSLGGGNARNGSSGVGAGAGQQGAGAGQQGAGGAPTVRQLVRNPLLSGPTPSQQLQQQQQPAAPGPQQPQQIPRMSDNLVTSLVAQSLDLPPQAARWRHQQRSGPGPQRAPGQAVYSLPTTSQATDDLEDAGDEEGAPQQQPLSPLQQLLRRDGAGGAKGDVRSRVAGMLQKDRDCI